MNTATNLIEREPTTEECEAYLQEQNRTGCALYVAMEGAEDKYRASRADADFEAFIAAQTVVMIAENAWRASIGIAPRRVPSVEDNETAAEAGPWLWRGLKSTPVPVAPPTVIETGMMLCVDTELDDVSLQLRIEEACRSLPSGRVSEVRTEEGSSLVRIHVAYTKRYSLHDELCALSIPGVKIAEVHFAHSEEADEESNG